MLKKFFLFFLLWFPHITAVRCQIPEFSFKNININEGLSQSSVVDIASDDLGFMWFATQDGLNRFDGHNFIHFPALFDDITSPEKFQLGKIINTGDNKLWMITTGGILEVMDYLTQKVIIIKQLSRDSVLLPPVSCLKADQKGNLWIGTLNDGLWFYDKAADLITRHTTTEGLSLYSNTIQAIHIDAEQNIWVLSNKGLQCITPNGRKDYLPNVKVSSISISNKKDVWVGTLGMGVYLKSAGDDRFRKFNGIRDVDLPPNLVVSSVLADEKGLLWIGTYGNGLFIINTKSTWIKHITAERKNPFSLGFNDVLCIRKDAVGDIWIGTDGGGISYYNKNFNNFNLVTAGTVPNDISIEQIRAIHASNSDLVYIGTSNDGVTAANLADHSFKTVHLKPFKKGVSNYDRVVSLQSDADNDLWMGTNGNGLLIIDSNLNIIKKWFTTENVEEKNKLTDNTIWAMLKEAKNMNWLGTGSGGLLLVDKEKGVLKKYNTKNGVGNNSIKSDNIRCLVRINDTLICVGFEKAGIQFLNTQTENFINADDTMLQNYFQGQTVLKSLYWDETFLWIGTAGNGIIIYNRQNQETVVVNTDSGLPNNTVYGILPEKENSVWVSMNKGIARIQYKNSNGRFALNSIKQYTVKDGLQSNEFNTGAYTKSSDGILYFGGIKGLNSFDPSQLLQNQKIPPVYLTGFTVSDIPYTSDTLITYKRQVQLSYKQNSISFNYVALDFVSPEKLNYEYILENYDDHWINAGNRNYAAYTNLPAGTYVFRVRIAGDPEMEIEGLTIVIASPFWARWWFIAATIAFILGILYSFYRYRINQLLEIQKVRNKISADLHDDIGSRLTNIQLLSAISKQQLGVNSKEGIQLDQIQEQVELSAEALDEIVWNMKVKDDAINNITARMRRYAGEVFEADNIAYHTDVKDPLHGELAMEKRRDLFLVFREILNNIRKHAHPQKVVIEISSDSHNFLLHIKDDGVGFNSDQPTNRNGLANMKERISRCNGKIVIHSSPGKGTDIFLSIPFEKISPLKRIFRGNTKT